MWRIVFMGGKMNIWLEKCMRINEYQLVFPLKSLRRIKFFDVEHASIEAIAFNEYLVKLHVW